VVLWQHRPRLSNAAYDGRVTHEYVIALSGRILGSRADTDGPPPTAIAWAADRVLAVGSDTEVRAVSRGDSTFLDLRGCAVTPLPRDVSRAEEVLRQAILADRDVDVWAALAAAGLIDSDSVLEPGSPADLAVWSTDSGLVEPAAAATMRVLAQVRAGAFTEGDAHCGPLPRLGRLARPASGATPAEHHDHR
jgi:hypothetical protein